MALRKIVRNRPSLSCLACRRRKIKCEKQRPACANCVRLGDECVYETEADHREKAAAKKRKVLDQHHHHHQLHQDHHPLHDLHETPDAHDTLDALDSHQPSPATDPEVQAVGGWATPPSLGLPFQWDAPSLGFDLDFDTNFDFGLLTPSLSLNSFQLDGAACPIDALPNRRDSPPRAGSPFEGYISTQEDGSKLFVERTFWGLVNRDASIPLHLSCCAAG